MYEELVKRLIKCEQFKCNECDYKQILGCRTKLTIEAVDAIENLDYIAQTYAETVHELNEKNRWIPVTERLPNCNGCYLVWRSHFFGGEIGMPSICYFDGTNTWHDSYGVDFTRILHSEDVTHWMPLPEPPKEETR